MKVINTPPVFLRWHLIGNACCPWLGFEERMDGIDGMDPMGSNHGMDRSNQQWVGSMELKSFLVTLQIRWGIFQEVIGNLGIHPKETMEATPMSWFIPFLTYRSSSMDNIEPRVWINPKDIYGRLGCLRRIRDARELIRFHFSYPVRWKFIARPLKVLTTLIVRVSDENNICVNSLQHFISVCGNNNISS